MKKLKNLLIPLALLCALLVMSYESSAAQTDSDVAIPSERMSEIFDMAIHYSYGETGENYSLETDPVMQEVWTLRGDELRLFLDFEGVINLVSAEFFPPVGVGARGEPNPEQVTDAVRVTSVLNRQKQRELFNVAQRQVFDANTGPDVALNELEQDFVDAIQIRLEAVATDQGETIFPSAHFQRREFIVDAIDAKGYRIYLDSDRELEAQAEALELKIAAEEAAAESQD